MFTKWDVENKVQVNDSDMYVYNDNARYVFGNEYLLVIEGVKIYVLDKETGEITQSLDTIHNGNISRVYMSADSHKLFTQGFDDLLLLWDLDTGTYIPLSNQFRINWRNPIMLNFDGSILATGCIIDEVEKLCLWDGQTGEFLRTIEHPIREAGTVIFNHKGTQIITSGNDGTIRLWGIGD